MQREQRCPFSSVVSFFLGNNSNIVIMPHYGTKGKDAALQTHICSIQYMPVIRLWYMSGLYTQVCTRRAMRSPWLLSFRSMPHADLCRHESFLASHCRQRLTATVHAVQFLTLYLSGWFSIHLMWTPSRELELSFVRNKHFNYRYARFTVRHVCFIEEKTCQLLSATVYM